ncbi:MAG: AI-2E family transporter [Candidatus Liptonbacteria bacterium]|nr:AI-2E family transporter [Candidatus Liptonbacteria bacterium]
MSNIFEISWSTLWKITFFLLVVAILFEGRQFLLALFLALVISSGLEAVVNFLERKGLPRAFGVILVFLAAIVGITFVLYTIVPTVIGELGSLFAGLRGAAGQLGVDDFFAGEAAENFNRILSQLSGQFFAGDASPLLFFSQIVGGIGLVAAVFATSFYLSLSKDGVPRFIQAVFPADYEEAALRIYERSRRKIGMWFRIQLLLSLIMGLLVWIALTLLGVPHAFLLAVFTALFEIIPYVGPILSGAIAVAVSLNVSLPLALYTLLVFVGLQQLENNVLVPFLSGRSVGLHPVIVIAALFIGAQAGGFMGLLIAVPAAAVLQEVVEEWSSAKRKPKPAAV